MPAGSRLLRGPDVPLITAERESGHGDKTRGPSRSGFIHFFRTIGQTRARRRSVARSCAFSLLRRALMARCGSRGRFCACAHNARALSNALPRCLSSLSCLSLSPATGNCPSCNWPDYTENECDGPAPRATRHSPSLQTWRSSFYRSSEREREAHTRARECAAYRDDRRNLKKLRETH